MFCVLGRSYRAGSPIRRRPGQLLNPESCSWDRRGWMCQGTEFILKIFLSQKYRERWLGHDGCRGNGRSRRTKITVGYPAARIIKWPARRERNRVPNKRILTGDNERRAITINLVGVPSIRGHGSRNPRRKSNRNSASGPYR